MKAFFRFFDFFCLSIPWLFGNAREWQSHIFKTAG